MARSTFWAIPFPNIKRQFIDNTPAVSTALRAREPSVNCDQCPTVPLTLVLQLSNQLTPATIGNRLSQLVVFHHVLHRQVLNRNHLVFAYQLSRQLVQKIFTGISYLSLDFCHTPSSFLPIFRAFDAARQSFLRVSQLQSKTLKVMRVSYLLTITGCNQRGDPDIYSNLFIRDRHYLNRWLVNQQGDKPSSQSLQPYCYSRWFNLFGESPTPPDRQALSALGQPHLSILPFEGGTSKLGTPTSTLLFKVGILGSSCPEVPECFLKVSQSLLKRNRANLIEKLQVFLLFPQRQHSRCFDIPNPLLSFVPPLCANVQSFVVDQPNATQCAAQELFLLRRWVKAISVGSLGHVLHSTY